MKSIAEQRAFYNERWLAQRSVGRKKVQRCIGILEAVLETEVTNPRILDLGCGSGWLTSVLGMMGEATGVDLSDTAIQEAKSRYPGARFEAGDVLEWRNGSAGEFDIVVSQEVIEHIVEQEKYISVAYDALCDGGYLILTTPNKRRCHTAGTEYIKLSAEQPIENWLTIGELRKLMISKFQDVQVRTLIGGIGGRGVDRWINSTRLRRMMRRLGVNWIYEGFLLKAGFGLHTLIVGRKTGRRT